jgi:subtilisin family serine protease
MNHETDAKIHGFLLKSLDGKRTRMIAQQTAAALRFELIDERIEEREYDEQERLRVDRVIRRRVFRGEAHERYVTLVSSLRDQGAGSIDLESKVRSQLDRDLSSAASTESVHSDTGGSLQRYSDLMPPEKWPVMLCMAKDPDSLQRLKDRLVQDGFSLLISGLLEQLGIFKLTCPPEMSFLRQIARWPETATVADALTPVTIPTPMAVTTMMAESREILGLTTQMRSHFGQDVTLAVLDTGIDRNHPACSRIADEDYRDFTSSGTQDSDGHGTHVASIAAGDDPTLGGVYSGITPRCHLIAGKVLSPGKAGNLESILEGMAWAVFEKHADILSLSLGEIGTLPTGNSIWSRACDEASRSGTVVCVAAGNPMPAYPESICVPGDAATVVTVGAIDKARQLAPFSAMGSPYPESLLYGKPNCVGPGVDVIAARSSAAAFESSEVVDRFHVRLSGTSMAAPAIAGCLALIKSKARSLGWTPTPSELMDLFYAACRPVTDQYGQAYRSDMQVGHGLIDMEEAFREAEHRASAHAQATTADAVREEPRPIPQPPAAVPPQVVAAAAESFPPDVCYSCGKQYLTRVGVFSPVRQCRQCGAPICQICWQLGHRNCEKHEAHSPAPSQDLLSLPVGTGASASPPGTVKGISTMTASNGSSPKPAQATGSHWGESFLNRFDLKVRNAGQLIHPRSGEMFHVDAKLQAQSFRRIFGFVAQFPLAAGLLKKDRLILAAIRLEATEPVTASQGRLPADDILQQIAGPNGLDFKDEVFYCVGVFSPAGWPEEWKLHAEARGNAVFFLVEKGEGTCWNVYGPKSPLRDLFDPEIESEKRARAEKALAECPRLVLPGDQVAFDLFMEDSHLDQESVAAAIGTSGGRFQVLEHKGKSYIQRSSR